MKNRKVLYFHCVHCGNRQCLTSYPFFIENGTRLVCQDATCGKETIVRLTTGSTVTAAPVEIAAPNLIEAQLDR